ncbi:PIG-L family deacetylase [Rhodococcus aerolatus]
MAVHAHPDDEVISTGGVLARAVAQGVRTVLVTCTGGEQGDGPGGVKPGEQGHDPESVRATRREELARSCAILGIEHVELLGYRDSGMEGWETAQAPEAFANVDLDEARERLDRLVEQYRPDVVVTYDERGGYGHPDHVMAHRVAVASTEATGIPQRLYFSAVPRSALEMGRQAMAAMREAGADISEDDLPDPAVMGTDDELITTVVDVSAHVEQKRDALRAHASQSDGAFLLGLPEEMGRVVFGSESFVRVRPAWEGGERETDLWDGLDP